MINWNFRKGWFGTLVLQRFVTWDDDGRECGQWRDVTISDLRDYYNELGAAK